MEATWQSMTIDQFCKDHILTHEGPGERVATLFSVYKGWSRFNYEFKSLSKAEFIEYMSKKYEYYDTPPGFKNIRIIYEQEKADMEAYRKLLPRCDKCNHLL